MAETQEHMVEVTSGAGMGLRVYAWTCSCGDGCENLDSHAEATAESEAHLDAMIPEETLL